MDGIKGFKGQTMSGQKAVPPVAYGVGPGVVINGPGISTGAVYIKPTTGTWVVPQNGVYEVALWTAGALYAGGGANGTVRGSSLAIKRARLVAGQSLPWIVPGILGSVDASVTFPDGTVMTVTAPINDTVSSNSIASGGDINVQATTGDAASYGAYVGGLTGYVNAGSSTAGSLPGGGGGGSSGLYSYGGAGQLIVTKVSEL